MTEEEKIQRLIRLKRHEKPREGYFEDFLEEFQSRHEQESGSAKSGAKTWSLAGWFRGKGTSGWVLGSGLAYAALVILILWWPKGPESGTDQSRQPVIYEPKPEQGPKNPPPEVPPSGKEF